MYHICTYENKILIPIEQNFKWQQCVSAKPDKCFSTEMTLDQECIVFHTRLICSILLL